MTKLPDYEKDFITFLECGFIAVSQLDEPSAKDLFHVCELLQPHNPLVAIAKGYMHFTKMELAAAAKIFEELTHKDPHNEMAKAFLGLTYSLSPKTMAKGEKILTETETKSHDPAVKTLAHDTLAFVDLHLKRPTSAPRKQT